MARKSLLAPGRDPGRKSDPINDLEEMLALDSKHGSARLPSYGSAAEHKRHQFELLGDEDVFAILSEVNSSRGVRLQQISRDGAQKLKHQINAAVALARSRQEKKTTRVAPHQRLADLARIRIALKAALDCLDSASGWLQNALDEEVWSRHHMDGEGDALTVELARDERHPKHNVAGTYEALKFIDLCLEAHEASLRGYQEARKTKEHPRRPDLIRYLLIADLARVFEKTFHRPTTAYVSGPWCSFLAHVLSCCEAEPVDSGNALRLWSKVRKTRLHVAKVRELVATRLLIRALKAAGR